MAEETEAPTRKGKDPIMLIGAIVLVLAFAVVISGYAYGELTDPPKEPARYGDKVKVDYIGSYYGYYDAAGAAVFDTSKWSIADDDNVTKSWEFNKREEKQYVPFNVTIGSGGALTDFENVLIGMKPGDTARISIENAYGEVNEAQEKVWGKTATFTVTETMSLDMYKVTFAVDNVLPGPQPALKHPYGWMSTAFLDSFGIVTVTHNVENSKDYFNVDESIKSTVSGLTATGFTVTFEFPDYEEGRLIQFVSEGQKYFITDVSATGFTTKSTDEKTGMTLYFVITFVDYQ